MSEIFRKIAHAVSEAVGSSFAFIFAFLIIILWALSGPYFRYSDTWQLIINTGTTILTFLMVFLIQNTQNRDSRTIHLKLDELIRSVKAAHNKFIDLDNLSDEELDKLQKDFESLNKKREQNRS
jgi:low affinity Fe/Cu permease